MQHHAQMRWAEAKFPRNALDGLLPQSPSGCRLKYSAGARKDQLRRGQRRVLGKARVAMGQLRNKGYSCGVGKRGRSAHIGGRIGTFRASNNGVAGARTFLVLLHARIAGHRETLHICPNVDAVGPRVTICGRPRGSYGGIGVRHEQRSGVLGDAVYGQKKALMGWTEKPA